MDETCDEHPGAERFCVVGKIFLPTKSSCLTPTIEGRGRETLLAAGGAARTRRRLHVEDAKRRRPVRDHHHCRRKNRRLVPHYRRQRRSLAGLWNGPGVPRDRLRALHRPRIHDHARGGGETRGRAGSASRHGGTRDHACTEAVSVARAFQPVIFFAGKTKPPNHTGWKARATALEKSTPCPPRPHA